MVIIVGAGPAGLATAASLRRRGIPYRLLERGDSLGYSWHNLYDSLRLHTGKHLSHLPGHRFGAGTSLFPSREEFVAYLHDYARHFQIPVETGQEVVRAERRDGGWRVHTAQGAAHDAATLVMTTGIIANPRRPVLPGEDRFRGRVLHSVEYRRPNDLIGRRVLVVGVGNSGGEIGAELAQAGAKVTVAVRSGANVVPLSLGGVPIQYIAYAMRALPRGARERIVEQVRRIMERKHGPAVLPRPGHSPLDAIPLIGFHLVDAIRQGLIAVRLAGVTSLTESGVRFSDGAEEEFDAVLLATGFAPALRALGDNVRTDAKGLAYRTDRVTSADRAGLFFVGHNYDSTGALSNIRRDARLVADRLARG
ncbi:MAG TPA: NAD(P)/FAD-dependent oxidoreductase [Gemmatimonadaceae bacterium]|nr:NAD(P)/FAD-dependent oxidoreductase [Gemmatimonadaceae bacterium]